MFFFFPIYLEEGGEIFQVKKSSHSKKVMKMMDKERRKKKTSSKDGYSDQHYSMSSPPPPPSFSSSSSSTNLQSVDHLNSKKRNNLDNSNSIQTEIRTDDFVVRLLLSIFYIIS